MLALWSSRLSAGICRAGTQQWHPFYMFGSVYGPEDGENWPNDNESRWRRDQNPTAIQTANHINSKLHESRHIFRIDSKRFHMLWDTT